MPAPPTVTRFDVTLACALAALGVAEAAVPFSTVMGDGSPWLAGTLAGLTTLTLAARRRHPLAVMAAMFLPWALASVLVPVLVLFWGALVPMCVAAYSVTRHGPSPTPYVGAGLGAAALLVFSAGTGMITEPGELFFPWLMLATAWAAGYVIQRKHHAATTSEQRAREVEAASREEIVAALAEERVRIARELHDIVAHTVTAIVVQAGAAREVVEDDPDYVRQSLDRIRQAGSEALDEMRRVVVLLRVNGDPEPVSPQPGLADLDLLVARARSAQTRAVLRVEGEPRALPIGVDLAAYRIVQEALTNVHRHAAASEVQVAVRYRPAAVEVEVCDNGVGSQSREASGDGSGHGGHGSGHGLIGMRERASMYGGRLHVSSVPGTGFQVQAVIPLEEAL
jgi:signal transduction histidine kinase